MSSENNFRINTSNYLGLSNAKYKNNLLKMALTKPEDYFKLRATVLENLTEQLVKSMFNTFYYVMTNGKINTRDDGSGGDNCGGTIGSTDELFVSNMAYQDVSEFALAASKTLHAICEERVEEILPINYKNLAEQRLARKGEAKLGLGGSLE
jgi:hypothetical protein